MTKQLVNNSIIVSQLDFRVLLEKPTSSKEISFSFMETKYQTNVPIPKPLFSLIAERHV